MPRRGIKDSKVTLLKKELIDKDVFIEETPFAVPAKLITVSAMRLMIDDYENLISEISEVKVYDRNKYVTISDSNNLDYDEIIRSLSLRAYKVFKYIKQHLKFNSNYIILSTDDILNIINDKYKSNAYAVIKELIDKKIIARNKTAINKNTIVINHNLMFRGSYNRFVHKYNKIYDNSNNNINNIDDAVNDEIKDEDENTFDDNATYKF